MFWNSTLGKIKIIHVVIWNAKRKNALSSKHPRYRAFWVTHRIWMTLEVLRYNNHITCFAHISSILKINNTFPNNLWFLKDMKQSIVIQVLKKSWWCLHLQTYQTNVVKILQVSNTATAEYGLLDQYGLQYCKIWCLVINCGQKDDCHIQGPTKGE